MENKCYRSLLKAWSVPRHDKYRRNVSDDGAIIMSFVESPRSPFLQNWSNDLRIRSGQRGSWTLKRALPGPRDRQYSYTLFLHLPLSSFQPPLLLRSSPPSFVRPLSSFHFRPFQRLSLSPLHTIDSLQPPATPPLFLLLLPLLSFLTMSSCLDRTPALPSEQKEIPYGHLVTEARRKSLRFDDLAKVTPIVWKAAAHAAGQLSLHRSMPLLRLCFSFSLLASRLNNISCV